MEGLGAGLASLAFWGFIAAVVVGGMWYALRERQAQYETIRSLIESGQTIDEDKSTRRPIASIGVVHQRLIQSQVATTNLVEPKRRGILRSECVDIDAIP